MAVKKIREELVKYISQKQKKNYQRFFRVITEEGEKKDKFIGVRVPDLRKIAKRFVGLIDKDLLKLLRSEVHEERLLALLVLVEENEKAIKSGNRLKQKKIVNLYLRNKGWVNNWDLVDLSAHYILGRAVFDRLKPRSILTELVNSSSMWDRRIAIIASWTFIKNGEIDLTLRLAKKLLADKEDLIHKAVGWMLRECWKLGEGGRKFTRVSKGNQRGRLINKKDEGKKAQKRVEQFLIKNYNKIPRTTLRYAIERMDERKRKKFLKGELV